MLARSVSVKSVKVSERWWATFDDSQVFSRDSHVLTLDTGRGKNVQDGADWDGSKTHRNS